MRLGIVDGTPVYAETAHAVVSADLDREVETLLEQRYGPVPRERSTDRGEA